MAKYTENELSIRFMYHVQAFTSVIAIGISIGKLWTSLVYRIIISTMEALFSAIQSQRLIFLNELLL